MKKKEKKKVFLFGLEVEISVFGVLIYPYTTSKPFVIYRVC